MALQQVVGPRRRPAGALRRLASPAGLRGCGAELAWLAAHAATYPLGLRPERPAAEPHRIAHLPPQQRGLVVHDLAAAATPILLVHGMAHNRSVFIRLRRSLRRRGFGRIRTVNYSVFTSDVRLAAGSLGEVVESLCEQTGHERVHVVAHSLGGLIARYHVQRLGGDRRVHTLATLGTPHGGTAAAQLLPLRLCRQLRPGSELVTELAQPARDCRTRFLAVWSDLDQLIYPKWHAGIEHPDLDARNVLLRGVGHMSLPVDGRVAREVVRALVHLDRDGSAVELTRPPAAPEWTLPAPARIRKEIGTAPFG